MKKCEDFHAILRNHLTGEALPDELESLQTHCRSCSDCRALMDLHLQLAQAGEDMPVPREADLQNMRAGVLAQISRNRAGRARRSSERWRHLGAMVRLRPAFALPIAVVLILGAVFLGRWSTTFGPARFDDQRLLGEINRLASRQVGLDGYWDTPYSYSNVSVRPVNGVDVDLSFDVSRRVRMRTPSDSPVAKEVLLHAILSPAPLGSRIKAMELAPGTMDPKLKEALIFALHRDPDLTIRIEALSVLGRYPYDPGVRDAMLTTLRLDHSVQMRLLALERLADRQVKLETLQQAIGESGVGSNRAVMQHAMYLTGTAIGEP